MDLLPDLSITAEIEDLVAQDHEIDKDNLENPKIETITKDNNAVEVESVDNMFVKKETVKEETSNIEPEQEPIVEVPVKTTKRGRPKKPATDKQKAHLARIRQKALETRRKNSELKKQAVLDMDKKIKETKKNKREKEVKIVEPEIEEKPIINQTINNKVTELEQNEFQKFLGNMNKFMQLQNQHEQEQRKIAMIREKQQREKMEREKQKKNIKVSKPQQIPKPQTPQRQYIPGINAPIPQSNPYDDYFG
jgi:hypothetical protein